MTIAKRTATALLLLCGLMQAQSEPSLLCAGGTFPDPIYQTWIQAFEAHSPGTPIRYRAVGSVQAIQELKVGVVDFAASDFPPADQFQAELGIRLVPTLVGAAVPIYNLPKIAADLRFTPQVLADIYLGKITRWNDPRIKSLNRRTELPSDQVVVVHRSDGSGTSYLWTEFLSHASSEWKDKLGASPIPNWPVGEGEKGNEGIAGFVSRTPFSLGYVQFIYALRSRLSYASVRNPVGTFVQPSIDTIAEAASSAARAGPGGISIVNAPGHNAYPVCSFTWFLVPLKMRSEVKRQRLAAFLDWALTKGQHQVGALGYVPLPEAVAASARNDLGSLLK